MRKLTGWENDTADLWDSGILTYQLVYVGYKIVPKARQHMYNFPQYASFAEFWNVKFYTDKYANNKHISFNRNNLTKNMAIFKHGIKIRVV